MPSAEKDAPRFAWDGNDCGTIGQLLDAAMLAQRHGRAQEFLAAYRAFTEHADANLGYVIGYVEPAERRCELYEAFALSHPIFGGRP